MGLGGPAAIFGGRVKSRGAGSLSFRTDCLRCRPETVPAPTAAPAVAPPKRAAASDAVGVEIAWPTGLACTGFACKGERVVSAGSPRGEDCGDDLVTFGAGIAVSAVIAEARGAGERPAAAVGEGICVLTSLFNVMGLVGFIGVPGSSRTVSA